MEHSKNNEEKLSSCALVVGLLRGLLSKFQIQLSDDYYKILNGMNQ